jgi:capsular polysaccharide biosynthesis protein
VKTLLVGAITASLLVAAVVTAASLLQTPTYEASALLGMEKDLSDGKMHPIPPLGERQALTQTMIMVANTSPVARETIQRLGLDMPPEELLSNLSVVHVVQVETSQYIRLTYTDTDPARAQQVVNTVGQVTSEHVSSEGPIGANGMRATLYDKASMPETPVSPKPLRNGLLTLVVGLVLCAGLALILPGVGTRDAGTLGERPSRQGVGQAGVLGRRHRDHSIVERIKEKKLLRALGRRGKLTAVEAALETSLSVEESDRILSELAARGHLKVTVEHGKLLYSFWEHDAP